MSKLQLSLSNKVFGSDGAVLNILDTSVIVELVTISQLKSIHFKKATRNE